MYRLFERKCHDTAKKVKNMFYTLRWKMHLMWYHLVLLQNKSYKIHISKCYAFILIQSFVLLSTFPVLSLVGKMCLRFTHSFSLARKKWNKMKLEKQIMELANNHTSKHCPNYITHGKNICPSNLYQSHNIISVQFLTHLLWLFIISLELCVNLII